MSKELKNKPLVEAILEIRWRLHGVPPNPPTDPHYQLLLGRLFDRMLGDYPEHEQLPAANIPEPFAGHIVQHRFRVASESWPLVQIGPGVFTFNSTSEYQWPDFRSRVCSAVNRLYEAHPHVSDLHITNMTLRYIDAVPFNYEVENGFSFLKDKLKVEILFPSSLFDSTGVASAPQGFASYSSFKCEKPKGIVSLRFATGQSHGGSSIVWETMVESADDDLPQMPEAFEEWAEDAHKITDDWFFKMIKGELEEGFSNG